MIYADLTKIFILTSLGFIVALLATPLLANFLYKYKLGKQIRNDGTTPIFSELHKNKEGTPTMGGVLVWGTLLAVICLFWVFDQVVRLDGIFGGNTFQTLNFLTRRETLLPLGAFIGASIVGLIDDFLDVRKKGHNGRGLRFRFKIWLYAFVAIIGAWWFYWKLGIDYVNLPFVGEITFGWLFVPFFILTVIATSFAVNQTDGLDGLAGGTLLIAFFSYGLIAYMQGRTNLAAFIGVVCGALLAFLWFNVHPARFFMGDTGSMGLGVLLAIVAFLTNSILLLPLIGFIFLIEAVSTILQIASKKIRGKKVFISAPIHNHYQGLGWPESKVTMRFWIVSSVMGIMGMIVYFIG